MASVGGVGGPKPPRPRPQDIEFPQTLIGTPIPIVYGTVRVDAPVLVWLGNEAKHFEEFDNWYRYEADLLYVLGVPPSTLLGTVEAPTLLRFWYGDVDVQANVGVLHGNYKVANGWATNSDVFVAKLAFFDGRVTQERPSR